MGTPLAAEDIDDIGPNIPADVKRGHQEYGNRRYIRPGFKQCSRPRILRFKGTSGAPCAQANPPLRRIGDAKPQYKQSIYYKEIKHCRRKEIEAYMHLLELGGEEWTKLHKVMNEVGNNLGWLDRARAATTYVDLRDEILLRHSEAAPRLSQQRRGLEASIEVAGKTLLQQAKERRSIKDSEQRLQRLEQIWKPHVERLMEQEERAVRREASVRFEQASSAARHRHFISQPLKSERRHKALQRHTILNSGTVKLKPTIEEVAEDMEASEEPLLTASWPLPRRAIEEWTYVDPREGWTRKVELEGDWQNPLESRWQDLERYEMAPASAQALRFPWRNEDYTLLEPHEQSLRDHEDIERRRRNMQRGVCLKLAELEQMRTETSKLRAENGVRRDTPAAPSGSLDGSDTASPLPEGADAARDSISDDDEDLWSSESDASL
ncbi:hypothetical protein BST61_g7329 [Cercospora zeina]